MFCSAFKARIRFSDARFFVPLKITSVTVQPAAAHYMPSA